MPESDGSARDDIDIDPEAASGWYSEETATFGDRLAAAREAAGIGQRDLAQRIGIKTGTLRKWEDDLAEPRANRLSMLAGMLGVSLTWLLTGKGEGVQAPDDRPDVPAKIAGLLNELRHTRGQMEAQLTTLAVLEKRLRRAVEEME